ncbi:MAG: hypothetical protein ABI693_09660 [Bryobacteraceae bacterium]
MKQLGILSTIAMFFWFNPVPVSGHDCGHYYDHHGSYSDCGRGPRVSRSGPISAGANLMTWEGKIVEVIYLPGGTADSGMVEIRVQATGQSKLIRLAPSGVLKAGGLRLREGDAVTIKGFAVVAMEGDLLVATELESGGKSLTLRDTQGRTGW